MYGVKIEAFAKQDQLLELVNEFLRPDQYEVLPEETDWEEAASSGRYEKVFCFNQARTADKYTIGREIYRTLAPETGVYPEWGVLTGVRPVKLAGELIHRLGSAAAAQEYLKDSYLLADKKARLLTEIYERQTASLGAPAADSVALYIGIPFCPTRCLYCSFASNQVPPAEIADYLQALLVEIRETGALMRASGLRPESLYIGGGTPTTLTAGQLARLLEQAAESFDLSGLAEYCVEAGRPDTIDRDKLQVIRDAGVGRISINPQTRHAATLERIGRKHSPEEIERAFQDALAVGFSSINCDLIAGLPEETPADFRDSLSWAESLGADNITVHALAVKRASRLREIDPVFHYKQAANVKAMIDHAAEELPAQGFFPYYLYRQKHMAGSCENVGYARPGQEGVYNVRIMDEHQTIIALGAGGISKVYYPEENRLERVANVTNYRQYIDRLEEMIERKRKGIFHVD